MPLQTPKPLRQPKYVACSIRSVVAATDQQLGSSRKKVSGEKESGNPSVEVGVGGAGGGGEPTERMKSLSHRSSGSPMSQELYESKKHDPYFNILKISNVHISPRNKDRESNSAQKLNINSFSKEESNSRSLGASLINSSLKRKMKVNMTRNEQQSSLTYGRLSSVKKSSRPMGGASGSKLQLRLTVPRSNY